MLCVKEISKTYKPKKGVPVKAVDKVSLSFADKGLVFILGKSGSGKSTLLNLMGGLDKADSGEFIIKGKSSKDFNSADFNAYRNTCVGFIFQEYNILSDFNVGENIAMALEFQGKTADKETLENILKEVDLEGYAKRKPNELSGGQKQRVAIARALIKNPEIIMADEPTGALDADTGRQILETLKKLSKDKLVIVVSHDREFAEQFADRIIELADGKVISDIAKKDITPSQGGDKMTVNFADNDNDKLAEDSEKYDCNHKFIRSRLPYKRAFKMGVTSIKSKPLRLIITMLLCFFSFTLLGAIDTAMSYDRDRATIEGLTNVGYDSIAAVGGIWYNATYTDYIDYYLGLTQDELDELKERTGLDFMGVASQSNYGWRGLSELCFADKSKLTGDNNSPYYTSCICGFLPADSALTESVGELIAGRLPACDKEIVITKYLYEQFALAGYDYKDDETGEVIYCAPSQIKSPQEFLEMHPLIEYNHARNYKVLRRDTWTVVGILDTGADKNGMFEELKPSDEKFSDMLPWDVFINCEYYFRYGYHSLGYIYPSQYEEFNKDKSVYSDKYKAIAKPAQGSLAFGKNNYGSFLGVATDKSLDKVKDIIWLDGRPRTKLEDNELVIGLKAANEIINSNQTSEMRKKYRHRKTYFGGRVSFRENNIGNFDRVGAEIAYCQYAESVPFDKLKPFIDYVKEDERRLSFNFSYTNEDFWEFDFDVNNMEEWQWRFAYANYLSTIGYSYGEEEYNGGYYENITGLPTGEQIANTDGYRIYIEAKLACFPYVTEFEKMEFRFAQGSQNAVLRYKNDGMFTDAKVVGIYVMNYEDINYFGYHDNPYVFSNKLYNLAPEKEFNYSFAVAKMPTELKDIEKLVEYHYEVNGRQAKLINSTVEITNNITGTVNAWLDIFVKYFMIAFAIVSVLQLSNYIAASISGRKKEIGILRALGAKSGDICAIFCTESIIVALINCALAIIATPLLCIGVNAIMPMLFHINVDLFHFGIRQVAVILALGIATALVASLLPIILICRKQPIQSIQGR